MNKMNKILAVFFCLAITSKIYPCTLWSANGDEYVLNGGTLIVKNRDWTADHRQILKLITPSKGFRYFGLFAEGNDEPGLKAGINEKGLVIVSSTAGSIPKKTRDSDIRTKNLISALLKECSTVDEALKRKDLFTGARNLMAADKTKTAFIEIGLNGNYGIREVSKGILYHTNHFVLDDMMRFNEKIGVSSRTRYDRIKDLLDNSKKPFDIKAFIKMSDDRNDGPDNSIYRTGKTEKSEKTVAVWIVYLSLNGDSEIYIKINNPGKISKIFRYKINDIFSGKKIKF